jgi:large repetitive protein
VPSDAFVHTQAGTDVLLTAQLADGSDLPNWVLFDAQSGKFNISPPEGFKGELKIKLIARDTQGREASTLFRFHVGEKRPTGLGRSGFTEQLRHAAQQTASAQRWATV